MLMYLVAKLLDCACFFLLTKEHTGAFLEERMMQARQLTKAHLLVVMIIGAEMYFHFCRISILLVTNLRQSVQPASPSSV